MDIHAKSHLPDDAGAGPDPWPADPAGPDPWPAYPGFLTPCTAQQVTRAACCVGAVPSIAQLGHSRGRPPILALLKVFCFQRCLILPIRATRQYFSLCSKIIFKF